VEPRQVELRDGSRVLLRPIEPDDKERLRAGFAMLGEESRRRRFMSPVAELTDEDLAYLTEVDHRRHEAIAAVDPGSGHILGVGRWVRKPGEREVAELAVAVADEWQGRGLGTQLVAALNDRAREEGIRRYEAIVSVDNRQVIDVLERFGAVRRTEAADPGTVELEAEIPGEGALAEVATDVPREGVGAALQAALRAAASGHLRLAGSIAEWVRSLVPWNRE
jgi:RimJ/RimL family protein N-acetyltransferase